MTLRKKYFENVVGKGEDASKQHFLLFPQCFNPIEKEIILATFYLSSANALNLVKSKKFSFGKGLQLILYGKDLRRQ